MKAAVKGPASPPAPVPSRSPATFALVPIGDLRAHEETEEAKVEEVLEEIQRAGAVREPILVSRDTLVILNGHHRVEALRRLGMLRVPAWVVDYRDPRIHVDRYPGSAMERAPSKEEIVRRARSGSLFPPKTSHHRVEFSLPPRSTPLAELA